jgi:hypothetical protein
MKSCARIAACVEAAEAVDVLIPMFPHIDWIFARRDERGNFYAKTMYRGNDLALVIRAFMQASCAKSLYLPARGV